MSSKISILSVQTYNSHRLTVLSSMITTKKKSHLIIVLKILIFKLFFQASYYYFFVHVCTLLSKLSYKQKPDYIIITSTRPTDLSQYLWFKLLKSSSLAIFFRYFVNLSSSLSLCLFLWASLKGLILRQNEIKKKSYNLASWTVCNTNIFLKKTDITDSN